MTGWTKALVLGAIAAGAVGCENLLGTFDVTPPEPTIPEAGASDVAVTESDGAAPEPVDAASDGGAAVVRPCEQDVDCPAAAMTPPGCALAKCVEKQCVYVPIDRDGDGFPAAGCVVDGKSAPGTDCADDEPTIFPGAPCSKLANGTDITYPTGAPTGACKAGVWDCKTGAAVCQGAVPPAVNEDCGRKIDANCNGVPDDGCACTPNVVEACGNVKGLPLPCKTGTRTCSPGGTWGDCIGNVEPAARDCSSTVDNDCNGQADKTETACNCTGGVAQGGSASCPTGKPGACATGSWTCAPSTDKQSGVFGACVAPTAGAKNCASTLDNDCNGVGDEVEIACGSPCLDPSGTGKPVAAAQKFSAAIWGCAGSRTFAARSSACNGALKSFPCAAQTWETYRGLAKGARVPARKYWVAEQLNRGGTSAACYADPKGATSCGTSSMAVCPAPRSGAEEVLDADGNYCAWTLCGYGYDDTTSGDYMGGCGSTTKLYAAAAATGGTLCCQ